MWSSPSSFWVISGIKGAFLRSTSGTDGNIYYSKHQSYIFLLFSPRSKFWGNNATLCNGAKKVKCCFPVFFGGLSCTVLYNRTVVSQPGDREVSGGFPMGSRLCCYGCRLFSQPALSRDGFETLCLCVCGEDRVLLWGRSINKQAVLQRTHRRAWNRSRGSFAFINLLRIYSSVNVEAAHSALGVKK